MNIATSALSHHPHHHQLHHQPQQTSDVSLSEILTANASNIHQATTALQLQQQHPQHQTSHCGYCCQPISDRYIMRVVDTSYHEGCLKCSSCAAHLVHSCFLREGKLFCRIDYERYFLRNRCLGCGDKIGCEELVMRTLENVFHLKCFACVVCGVQLKKGEQYVVKQGQLFCRFDYEKEVEMLQGYEDFYGDDLFPPKMDGRRGPKRPRTILNTQQRRAFKASFELSPKPCRKVRENLAKETGLVWFQNQRAKVKKIQKKAKQEHKIGNSETDSQESDNSLAKIKDENLSDEESMESPFSTPTDKANRLIKEEVQNENSPFNCPETNKENCNKNNEPILNTILGLSYATFQQLMGPFGQSSMLNPIDRLYSMQNSYFRPEELGFTGKDNSEN
uniref:LIM zinc-binding domain-containing protein n=1 Tax=Megaselia scalaris TaxID=36166 RepID=T1GUP4_MEGSC